MVEVIKNGAKPDLADLTVTDDTLQCRFRRERECAIEWQAGLMTTEFSL